MLRSLALGTVLAVVGCKSNTRSDDPELGVTNVPSKGSAGGFSASLGAELAGSGAAAPPPTTAPTGSSTGAPAAGSTTPGSPAASNTALGVALAASGSPTGGAGPASAAGTASASGAATGSAAASAAGTASASGTTGTASGAALDSGTTGTTTGSASASGAAPSTASGAAALANKPPGTSLSSSAGVGSTGSPAAAPVKVSAELAEIKLSLLPNWERDIGEAGTISLFVNVQRTGQTERFKFHYGYENPSAPVEREMYKKFLADSKLLRVSTDRQRGTAWLLEGRDATGGQAFRMVVVYGGKRLVCYGSLYKDSSLGEVRDEVLIAAKKICESISL